MKLILLLCLFLSISVSATEKKSFTQIREEQKKFFAENTNENLKDYDELELDLLYQDLETLSIYDLKSKYPELTPKELEELKTKRK
ncbi:MAG: hypothetical protein ACJ76H_17230 [Bacteriovoracaceae bacterium]